MHHLCGLSTGRSSGTKRVKGRGQGWWPRHSYHAWADRNSWEWQTSMGKTLYHCWWNSHHWSVRYLIACFVMGRMQFCDSMNKGVSQVDLWWSFCMLCLLARQVSYCRRLRSLLLCLCDIFQAQIAGLAMLWQSPVLDRKKKRLTPLFVSRPHSVSDCSYMILNTYNVFDCG